MSIELSQYDFDDPGTLNALACILANRVVASLNSYRQSDSAMPADDEISGEEAGRMLAETVVAALNPHRVKKN